MIARMHDKSRVKSVPQPRCKSSLSPQYHPPEADKSSGATGHTEITERDGLENAGMLHLFHREARSTEMGREENLSRMSDVREGKD